MMTGKKESGEIVLAVDLGASSGRVLAAEIHSDHFQLHDVHRFENNPISMGKRLHWDVLRLWQEIEKGIGLANDKFGERIRSIGVDTWGVDYVLLDRNQDLVGPAFCYRDSRTTGSMAKAFEKISRELIFKNSGIQFMEINTLYQLWSMRLEQSPLLDVADRFLMMPDFFHWLLSGVMTNEYTNASTTQFLDPTTNQWSTTILDALEIPHKLFSEPVQPGTVLGPLAANVRTRTGVSQNCRVIVPATHDTGSAVIAVPAKGFADTSPDWCYISSGTWSLMGVELASPILTNRCLELNFTNEGGANGSVRLLKNIAGLWPFQQLRAAWSRRGQHYDWSEMTRLASTADPLETFIDLEHPMFVAPQDMLTAAEDFLTNSGQSLPSDAGMARAALESLAMRYRVCLQWLEDLLGKRLCTIHIVGGGVQNELLCQMTANACNRMVVAGPVEATALGNVASQCIANGLFTSIAEVRDWMARSPEIRSYEPKETGRWDDAFSRYEKITARNA